MHKIIHKRKLAPDTYLFEVEAPLIAMSRRPGQFIMICPDSHSERIPISIAGGNAEKGTIQFVIQAIGQTTKKITALEGGDIIENVVGPLGAESELKHFGTVVFIGGGYGVAAILSIAQACQKLGNRVISIVGARKKELLILLDEVKAVSHEVRVSTNDGSLGTKGLVLDVLKQMIDEGEQIDKVFAIGPVPMMEAVSQLTRPYGISTTVSLNPIMVDGTGMCGGCRVEVGGEIKFACYEGPEFDGHLVDFRSLANRQKWYKEMELTALKRVEGGIEIERYFPIDENCPIEEIIRSVPIHVPPEIDPNRTLELNPRQRMKIPRQKMPVQDARIRVCNFAEVNLGFSPELAQIEAARCIQCRVPHCVEGCPVHIDIPAFIKRIEAGDFIGAAEKIKETNQLPAVCGRVCPQESQCEAVCIVGKKSTPVSIGRLERFAADYERTYGQPKLIQRNPTGKRVAVVGSGPAGLTVAAELIKKGHEVTVFEALHKFGGVLIYGIPEFRLPNEVVEREVMELQRLGVKFIKNVFIGRTLTVEELFKQGFHAVFLGTGAGHPSMLEIPGEGLKGIYTANEFLTRINLMQADHFPEYTTPVMVGRKVVVIGCGNTAIDAARIAIRLGRDEVTVVYRRSREEVPARIEELAHAEEEGVKFSFLSNPTHFIPDDNGWVKGLACAQMELGPPDESGRRRPIPIPNSEFVIETDTVVTALGFNVNPIIAKTTPGLEVDRRGVVVADPETGQTSREGVFAGGDVITGGATVILAMGQGKKAAGAIDAYLRGNRLA